MQNKLIQSEQEFVKTLKTIAQAYEEISVIKMQRIRSSVLNARNFLNDLSGVFMDVTSSYHSEIMTLYQKKKIKGQDSRNLLSKNGRDVVVLISSNAKLYGDIISRVTRDFLDYLKAHEDQKNLDIVIVGKVGKDLFEQSKQFREFTYFELPDSGVNIENLKSLAYFLANYQNVVVIYGRFMNVLTQQPTDTNISGEEEKIETSTSSPQNQGTRFLFEPSLEKILQFFETQVFSLLLKQTLHEAELSRVASRLQAMENALINIQKNEDRLTILERMSKKQLENKKRMETFSGMVLWKK